MLLTMLRRNRLRSVLATLGVFLGALLLTLILHVLESVNIMLETEARRLGSHVVTLTTSPVDFVRKSSMLADNGTETDTSLSETARSAEEPTEEERLLAESLGSENDEDWRTAQAPKSASLTVADIRVLEEELLQISAAAPFVLVSGQAANGTILGNCQLLGTVTSTKQSYGEKYVGTDIGFNVLMRPVLYDSYHYMVTYNHEEKEETVGSSA